MILNQSLIVVVFYLSACTRAEKRTGMTSEDKQREIANNIILLEKSNCNFKMSEMECFNLRLQSKWKYIDTFMKRSHCNWGAKLDLQLPGRGVSMYDVKCPGPVIGDRPARVYPLLTDHYLNKMGIVFRRGKDIVVPGEGTFPISEDWDNGTEDQRLYREEIGNNICDWDSRAPGPSHFCLFRKKKCRCMLELAKVYYVTTYSPTGVLSDYCEPGKKIDLHISSKCKITCPLPDHTVEWAEYAFTNANMYNVPWTCKRRSNWIQKLGRGL